MNTNLPPPKEIMNYKAQSQIKGNELITKLKVIRDILLHHYQKNTVAEKFGMHRNTIGKLVNQFKKKLPPDIQKKLLQEACLSKEKINKLMTPLKNKSTVPLSNCRSATKEQEALVVQIHQDKKVGVGPKRLHKFIRRKGVNLGTSTTKENHETEVLKTLSLSQLKGIYKRCKLRTKKVRTCNGQHTPLYDYAALASFERLHYDTKTIPDQKALPPEIYKKFKLSKDLPIIEWNIIDVKSRTRFIAYSHNRTADFGLHFLLLVVQFLRAKNLISWDMKIVIGTDNGSEFFSGSERKKKEWNKLLNVLNAKIYSYEPGHDVRKNLIERSHRTDDEEFFVPRGFYINSKKDFLLEAQTYSNYFNCERSHSGIGMDGLTPLEKLKASGVTAPEKILEFPTMIIEDHIEDIKSATNIIRFIADLIEQPNCFSDHKTLADIYAQFDQNFIQNAHYVLTHYPFSLY